MRELKKNLEGLFKQVNDLKEQIKKRLTTYCPKTTFKKPTADLKADINEKQNQLSNMQDCDKVIKEVKQLEIDNVLLKNKLDLLKKFVQMQSQQISTLKITLLILSNIPCKTM